MDHPATNPIHDWLDSTGVPWRVSRADLTARYGVSTDNPYRHEWVSLTIPPPLEGMLWPLTFNASTHLPPQFPPLSLSTRIAISNNPETNIRFVADQLAQVLGPKDVAVVANTLEADWRCDAALIRITAWPRRLQSRIGHIYNAAHAREPRLENACHVTIHTGWRLPISDQEQAWLDDTVPLGPIRSWYYPPESQRHVYLSQDLLAYMRFPPPSAQALEGQFGRSADKRAFLVNDGTLYIVPVDRIIAFDVNRMLPAKGSGGSALQLRCLTTNPASPEGRLLLASRNGPDELSDLAAELAQSVGKPVILLPYTYDA